ncbi:hypothetical protein [Streptomyces sp. PSKA30]|uniref:hypothetical protein n=1 Tax=Streptomyces sp. PSKA30 TaxID=2874597 RepID=UPI001CD15A1F|nr:hypothetical protein [Streptomyces sp. PSKA30]MBZ9644449.1 hypothetical protein [Streptomyces sp. PSKA30]
MRAAVGADGGYAADERLEGEAVVGIGRGHGEGERDALGLGQHMQFAALVELVTELLSDSFTEPVAFVCHADGGVVQRRGADAVDAQPKRLASSSLVSLMDNAVTALRSW